MVNKRGQFYLMAALIIILLIIGFATISNYSKTKSYSKIYNEEIGTEQMEGLLEGFIEEYSKIGSLDELYFVFGNAETIVFMGYQQLEEELSFEIGTNDGDSSVLKIRKDEVGYTELTGDSSGIDIVSVLISYENEQNEYPFKLKSGENFYFILSQVVKEEKYVEVGEGLVA